MKNNLVTLLTMIFLMYIMNTIHLFNQNTMTMMNLNYPTLEIPIMNFIEIDCKCCFKIGSRISNPIFSCILCLFIPLFIL